MTDFAQITGIVLLILLAISVLYIASDPRYVNIYQTALAVVGVYMLTFPMTRLLRLYEVVPTDDVFIINTISTGIFLSILVNLIAVQTVHERYGIQEKGEDHAHV